MRPRPSPVLVTVLLPIALSLAAKDARSDSPISLEAGSLTALEPGTHRPEILDRGDGKILLVVVHPRGKAGVGQVKHQAHTLDASTLEPIGEPFDVTRTTEEFGEPADHRILLVGEELVVVYQTLVTDGTQGRPNGPAETNAREQSLMLARFDLEGHERFRGPIVAHAERESRDNFPDFCIAWTGSELLVCSGTSGRKVRLREVDLEGKILSTHEYPTTQGEGIPEKLGNSLAVEEGGVRVFSARRDGNAGSLVRVSLGSDLEVTGSEDLGESDELEMFPVGNLRQGDFTFVSYIVERGGEHGKRDPRLRVLDAGLATLLDIEVGENGFAHVHPMMLVVGERLLVAWSRTSGSSSRRGPSMPQVVIQEYRIRRS